MLLAATGAYLLLTVLLHLLPELLSWIRYQGHQVGLSNSDFRKRPFVQLVDTASFVVQWETVQPLEEPGLMEFGWAPVSLQKDQRAGNGPRGSESTYGRHDMEYRRLGKRHHLYRVRLEQLPPDQMVEYYVRVQRETIRGSFHVVPDSTMHPQPPTPPILEPVEVCIISDNLDGNIVFSKIAKKVAEKRPHLVVHLGGLVGDARDKFSWQRHFFDPIKALAASSSFLLSKSVEDRKALGYLNDHQPHGHFHAVSIGPVRWIMVDSSLETDAQVQWLEAELSRPATQKAPFKVVVCHASPFPEYAASTSGSVFVKRRFVPLFEKHRVDLVLSGSQHAYQRGMHRGINYITSGGAGARLASTRLDSTSVYKKSIPGHHHYIIMSVSRTGMSFRVLSPSDRLLDTVYIPRSFARKMRPSEMLPQ